MCIYLYKKTHRKTGLKYLGKTTTANPNEYPGSGKYWTRHIKKHGYDIETEILRECKDETELKEWGLYYSNLWNVVESEEWANLKPEIGDGGSEAGPNNPNFGRKNPAQSQRMSGENNPMYGKPRPKELNEEHSLRMKGRPAHNTGKPMSSAQKEKLRVANLGKIRVKIVVTCPHCGKVGDKWPMGRWHFDRCKLKANL